ncbi:DUF305 domain-containing protein [Spirillospora sp. NPDC047279]|uniref:DUF305 domain-containing protein n=1 Tax=Spirillospora sp. NPDC047279 TaxID=3155478 RepID=UPI0033DD2770
MSPAATRPAARGGRAGRVFSAVAFMVIGAVGALLVVSAGGGGRSGPADARPAGKVEIGFAQDMIVHHQQAVTMAQTVLGRRGVGPSVSQIATGVQLNQLREIGQMQGWLTLWDAPQVTSGPPMTWMNGEHGTAHATKDGVMPGLASVQETNRLGELEGEELEVWFLQLMIRHHQGGLAMATAAARQTGDRHVRSLAVLMSAEQRQETATMTGLLTALGHKPLPSPAT